MSQTVISWNAIVSGARGWSLAGGLLLLLLAGAMLVRAEKRALRDARSLRSGAASVQHVSPDSIAAAGQDRFVHVSATATAADVLHDQPFGVAAHALKLRRQVEMYQWEEVTSSAEFPGAPPTTSYRKVWSSDWISSQAFRRPRGHLNPGRFPYRSRTWEAREVRLGTHVLPQQFVDQLDDWKPVTVSLEQAPPGVVRNLRPLTAASGVENGFYWQPFAISEGESSSGQPQVGDLRITYWAVWPQQVTVMAAQRDQTFVPFVTDDGRSFCEFAVGAVPAEVMLPESQAPTQYFAWSLRILSAVLMFAGCRLLIIPVGRLYAVVAGFSGLPLRRANLLAILAAISATAALVGSVWLLDRPLLALAAGLLSLTAMALLAKLAVGPCSSSPLAVPLPGAEGPSVGESNRHTLGA